MRVRSKHFLHRNRFVGGFVNIKIFSCPSKLCIVDPMEDSQFTNGFFLSDAQVSQVRGRPLECQQRGLEFLPVFLFPPRYGHNMALRWIQVVDHDYLLGTHGKISHLPGKKQPWFRSSLYHLIT